MADKSLVIRVLGDDSDFKSKLLKIAPTLGAISGAALLFGKTAIAASIESDKAMSQLGNTIEATGRKTVGLKEGILKLSTEIEHYSGISDEAVTSAQTMLLQFENIGDEAIPRATKAIADMATSMNGGATPSADQLREAAVKVGKALNLTAGDTEGVSKAIRGLTSEGIRFTHAQQDTLKSMVETGRISEAQTMILERMEARWKGAAAAAGKEFGGQLEIARQKADDFNEDAGKIITSVLEPMMRDFPGVTSAIVGTSGALSGMNVTTGDLLIAGPRLLETFGGWGGALATLGSTAAVAGTAFAAWEIGRMVGEIEIFGTSIDKLSESFFKNTIYALENANALKETENATNRIGALLKNPIVRQAGEDWKHFADRVTEAAKSEATAATNQAKLSTVMSAGTSTIKSHVITLQQQIEKQKALVATLSTQVGKDKELTEATEKLTQLLKKQAEPTEKVKKEMEGYGAALGITIPKLKEAVANGEKYVAYLKKAKPGSEELREAEQKLTDARMALMKATSPLIRETEKLLQATKDLDKAEISNAATAQAAAQNAQDLTGKLKSLGLVAGTELPAEFGKPKSAILELNASFKTLGITSTEALENTAREAVAAYESVRASGTASARDIEIAWVAMTEAQISAGERVSAETQVTIDTIKERYGSLKDDKNANLTTWRELASKQVSTLVSDVSKGFADILTSGGNFGSKIIAMFKQIGQGMLQGFFESGIGGLLSGKGLAGFGGFAGGLLDAIKGIGGGGKGGGLTSLAGLIPGLGGKGGLLAGLGGLGGLGIGGGGLIAGGIGGSLASIAGAGAVPGFLLAGGTVAGTAGAAGVGGGLAAGGAAGGGLASTLGALATNPITIAAAAAIAGVLLTRRLTRRGREKEDATTQAEDMSGDVWQGIVPEVQAGRATIDAGIAAIQQRFADYEAWLRANLKDQTVITRSIEGQRITLTEGIAALEALRGKEAETAAARGELESLIKQFVETGAITGALSEKIAELGGNLGPFKEMLKVPELEALRGGFAGLREELLKMGPPIETGIEGFFRTGQVTDELRAKIEEFGGSSSVFEQFAGIKTMRADFESLSASILTTGQGLEQVRPMFEQMGVSVSALDAAAALPGLQGLRGEFGSLLEQINQLLPATQSWQEQFLKTGIITDDMRKKIAEAGGDLEIFNKAAGEISAGGLSAGTASIVATELGKMTKGLDEQIADLQKGLTEALEEVGTKLDAQFEDSRTALIAQLDLLDGSLTTSIGSLQAALQTEVSNLAAAISGIKIPSEITVNVEQPADTPPAPEAAAPPTASPSYSPYQNAWNQGTTGWPVLSALAPSLQLQQQYGKSPELERISEMAIMPAVLERVQASVARLESVRGGSYAAPAQSSSAAVPAALVAPKLEQTNNYYRVSEDEYTLRQMQERANANFVDLLARGG